MQHKTYSNRAGIELPDSDLTFASCFYQGSCLLLVQDKTYSKGAFPSLRRLLPASTKGVGSFLSTGVNSALAARTLTLIFIHAAPQERGFLVITGCGLPPALKSFSFVGLALTEVRRLPCNPKEFYLEEVLGMAILATRQATGFGGIETCFFGNVVANFAVFGNGSEFQATTASEGNYHISP